MKFLNFILYEKIDHLLKTIKISENPNELENNKSIDSQNRGGPVEADIS